MKLDGKIGLGHWFQGVTLTGDCPMTNKITSIGTSVSQAASACGGGYFAILEGGYNPEGLAAAVVAHMDELTKV